jgi:sugar lactone lactonase YvrE
VPAAHVTSCAFAGPQLDQLVITTARRDTDRSEAGGLFVAEPGVQGRLPSLARIASPAPRPR